MAISESYKNRMKVLSGQKGTLIESARVDFLKNEFLERIGRKYDRFANKFNSQSWDKHHEKDKFILKLATHTTKLVSTKGILSTKDKFLKWAGSVFEQLKNNDPSENKQYLKWLSDIFLVDELPEEDFYKIAETLTLFQKNKEKLPINDRNANNYKNLAEMYEAILPYSKAEEMSTSEKERIIKLEGAEQVYEDDKWKIIIPTTVDAACLYGKSTRWCTASPGNSMFHSYSKNGPLYILIDKKEQNDRSTRKKLQFHFPTNQFMDTLDARINVKDFFAENPVLKDFFKKRKEITPAFEFEHKLLNKNELLSLLKTAEDKLDVVAKKGFQFFTDLYLELQAKDAYLDTILNDNDFIKGMFENNMSEKLIAAYENMDKPKEGVQVLKKSPWLNNWILSENNKKEISNFIVSLFQLGDAGKHFAAELCKVGGVVWKSCVETNSFAKIGQYFDIISHRTTFGPEGIAVAKKLLYDPKIITILKQRGSSDAQIEMLRDFFKVIKESTQHAQTYYRNLLG